MSYRYTKTWQQLEQYCRQKRIGRRGKIIELEAHEGISGWLEQLHRQKYIDCAELCERKAADTACICVTTRTDQTYPENLKHIASPPAWIYHLGLGLETFDAKHMISIVGSRHPTAYGEKVTSLLIRSLKHPLRTIVSGLAIGIDGIAHRAALSEGLNTIAVLGCGVDICYPACHQDLYRQIAAKGCLISEFEPGTPPRKTHFPARNRIISGLSRQLIVTEAGVNSGTLITAGFAADQGRDVYAIPGSIFMQQSQGCHQLINEGAKIILNLKDLNCLGYRLTPGLNREDYEILTEIHLFHLSAEELAQHLNRVRENLVISLGRLESLGLIEQRWGKYFLTLDGLSCIYVT